MAIVIIMVLDMTLPAANYNPPREIPLHMWDHPGPMQCTHAANTRNHCTLRVLQCRCTQSSDSQAGSLHGTDSPLSTPAVQDEAAGVVHAAGGKHGNVEDLVAREQDVELARVEPLGDAEAVQQRARDV